MTQHRGSNVEVVSKEEAEELEQKALIREEDEDGGQGQESKLKEGSSDEKTMKEATTVAREAVDLPGKKTQKQQAASAEDAQASVAD